MHAKKPLQTKRNPRKKGFTLIELVIVVAILTILAAVAFPRFISTSTQANKAKLNHLQGVYESTMGLIASQARMIGLDSAGIVEVEPLGGASNNVAVNDKLLPIADTNGIALAIDTSKLGGITSVSTLGNTKTFRFSISSTSNCLIDYNEDLTTGSVTISKVTTGC